MNKKNGFPSLEHLKQFDFTNIFYAKLTFCTVGGPMKKKSQKGIIL